MDEKKQGEAAKPLEKIFGSMENNAEIEVFNNAKFSGIDIAWSAKNWGFGHLTFGFDKEKDKFYADTECMGEESVQKILIMATPALAKLLVSTDKNGGQE